MFHVRILPVIITAVGIVLSDSLITVLKKVQFSTCSEGLPECETSGLCQGQEHFHQFNKPWMQTSLMFFGELTSLLYTFLRSCVSCCCCKRSVQSSFRRLNIPHWKQLLIIPLFAFCDLIATTLSSIGLLYVQASAFQILRGSVIIFNEVGSIIFLKQRCLGHRWIGIILVIFSLFLVALKEYLEELCTSARTNEQSSTNGSTFGFMIILLGQVASSVQMLLEERFLKATQIHPALVVAGEGLSGSILVLFVAFPLVQSIHGHDCGSIENIRDGIAMIFNNRTLLYSSLLLLIAEASYNILSLTATQSLSAVHRALIDSFTVVAVWLAMLFFSFFLPSSSVGEQWTQYSFLQFIGLALLFVGTLIFNNSCASCIKCPKRTNTKHPKESSSDTPSHKYVLLTPPNPNNNTSLLTDPSTTADEDTTSSPPYPVLPS